MKLRIFNWNEAVDAAVENKDEYVEFGDYVFGIRKEWDYWGKTVDEFIPDYAEGMICYVVDGMYVPHWACELIKETKVEPQESQEIPQGWLCPRCKRIVSPFVNYCECEG